MASTANMNLTLPDPTVTLGPTWATQINTAFDTVDSHDHTSGKGTQIKTASILINDDLEFNNFRVSEMEAVQFQGLGSTLTGATNALSIYASGGNLYYTNSSGTAVQLTDGGAIVSTPGAIISYETTSVSSNLTINPVDTFVYMIVDTSVAREITLPLANAVADGRIYIIKDATGSSNANNITVKPQGSDTIEGSASDYVLMSDFSSWTFVGDGVDAWHVS